MVELTDTDRAVLELAGRGLAPGLMANAIAGLEIAEFRFYQLLNQLLDTQAAEAAYPVLVHRLRRLRAIRCAARRPVGILEGQVQE